MALQVCRPDRVVGVKLRRRIERILPVAAGRAESVEPLDWGLRAQAAVHHLIVGEARDDTVWADIVEDACAVVEHDVKDDEDATSMGFVNEMGKLRLGRGERSI